MSLWRYTLKPKRFMEAIRGTQSDLKFNQRNSNGQFDIICIRHLNKTQPFYNEPFLNWLEVNYPKIAANFKLTRLEGLPFSLDKATLVIPWLQDPLRENYPRQYLKAKQIEHKCDHLKIPIINRVETLSNAVKSKALEIIRRSGIRTAKTLVIPNLHKFKPNEHGFSYPFLIRENRQHSTEIHRVHNERELKRLKFWHRFKDPIAMEYINVSDEQGFFRKYRYVLFGNVGVPRHMAVSRNWWIHARDKIQEDRFIEEELAYTQLQTYPEHALFNKARQALGFDFVAFDYSYDVNGQLIVWEPNPFPVLFNGAITSTDYQISCLQRLCKTMLLFYLTKAGQHLLIKEEGLDTDGISNTF